MVVEGIVEHGRQLGRELGFPTANLRVPDDFAAQDGVYQAWAEVGGVRYAAMSNLGENPSVGGTQRRLETHIFGFVGSLYGQWLRVELGHRIRGEQKFDTLAQLRLQIAADRDEIMKLQHKFK